jgi:hypothetical protein
MSNSRESHLTKNTANFGADKLNIIGMAHRNPAYAPVKVNNIEFSDENASVKDNQVEKRSHGISTHYGLLHSPRNLAEEKLDDSVGRDSFGLILAPSKIGASNFSSTTRDLKQSPFLMGSNPKLGKQNASQHKIL